MLLQDHQTTEKQIREHCSFAIDHVLQNSTTLSIEHRFPAI